MNNLAIVFILILSQLDSVRGRDIGLARNLLSVNVKL